MREFWIQKNEAGQRFDKYLKKLLCGAPSGFIYKMLRRKNIVLNEKKADGTEKLQINDNVKLYFSEETYQKFSQAAKEKIFRENLPEVSLSHLPFQILYEDEDILVINKPAGMLSQKAEATDVSANEYIISYLLESEKLSRKELHTFRPSVCNRLDRNTSGILIAGKTLQGLQEMSAALKERSVLKYYRCLVEGRLAEACQINGYLHKDWMKNRVFISDSPMAKDDKKIETGYRPIRVFPDATLLEVNLITGRTHQIRAHLSSIGHPVIGDFKYGASPRKNIPGMQIHAYRLRFSDGREITAPLPKKFEKAIHFLEKE